MVVTINSPVKSLHEYFITGGGSVSDYCQVGWYGSDEGICSSVTSYDSSRDGKWVGQNKHWLAFISGESAPLSKQFDVAGIDAWPRNMDDSIVPLSAQYSDGADVIYYGEYGHRDFTLLPEVAEFMADQILRYIFGGVIECSAFARGGTFGHEADWILGTDYWEDVVGEVLASSGSLQHRNESYTRWQEWEDVVGECSPGDKRSSSEITRMSWFPFLTSIRKSEWLNPDDAENCQVCLRTRAAPRSSVQVEWNVYQQGLLPPGVMRDHYEVEIISSTPLTGIRYVSWESDDPRDLRLRIDSEAQSPFRWFQAEWRLYHKESIQRRLIDEIPGETLVGTNQGG